MGYNGRKKAAFFNIDGDANSKSLQRGVGDLETIRLCLTRDSVGWDGGWR